MILDSVPSSDWGSFRLSCSMQKCLNASELGIRSYGTKRDLEEWRGDEAEAMVAALSGRL